MTVAEMLADRRLRAPEGEGGAGAAATEDTTTTTETAAVTETAAAEGTAAVVEENADWWRSSKFNDAQRDLLVKKGLTTADRDAAMAKLTDIYSMAEKRLGAAPDRLMQKPADPSKVNEWMRSNAEALGLPADVKGYDLADLQMPEGVDRNTDLEGKLQQIAFEEGVSPAAFKRFAETYAEDIGGTHAKVENDLREATSKMEGELKKDWGGQYGAKVLQAQQAFTALAQQANLDPDTQAAMFATLKETGGDASVMRLFATVGAMMGEDTLAQGGTPTLSKTPADARAEAARMRAEDGEYGKAYKARDQATMQRLMPRLSQLDKIAASG